MNIRQRVLEIVEGKTLSEISELIPDRTPQFLQYEISRLRALGRVELHDDGIHHLIDQELEHEVWGPDIPIDLKWPTDDQMKVIEQLPQYSKFGHVCPTCGKINGSDEIGTFVWKGRTYVCPDDDRGHIRLRLVYYYWLAGIGDQYYNLFWDEYPHLDAKDQVDRYIENIDRMTAQGIGFLAFGKSHGTGKTWLTTHVLKEAIKRGYSGYWTSFTDVLRLYKMSDTSQRDSIIDRIRNSHHLVVDDIAFPKSESQRNLFEEHWEEVMRYRTNMNLPTHVSTNLTGEEIEETYPRVYSLLSAKQCGIPIDGEDARISKVGNENFDLVTSHERRPIT